jgi:hypothetical protein
MSERDADDAARTVAARGTVALDPDRSCYLIGLSPSAAAVRVELDGRRIELGHGGDVAGRTNKPRIPLQVQSAIAMSSQWVRGGVPVPGRRPQAQRSTSKNAWVDETIRAAGRDVAMTG